MAKQWPDRMGVYKGMVLDCCVKKHQKNGLPQFAARVFLTEYYDQKEGEWFDVSDNSWTATAFLFLYGRKDGQADGEIVSTLNHTQVCKVFEWDGCGFGYLNSTDFSGREVQVRIAENTYEAAKCPITVEWIDVADADPNGGLQKLKPEEVKALDDEFKHLWAGNKPAPKAVSAKKPATAPKKAEAKTTTPPPATEPEAETPPTDDKEARKKALLDKSKRLLEANKAEAAKAAANAKKKAAGVPPAAKKTEPPKEEPPAEEVSPVPVDYSKKQAWNDLVEVKRDDVDDEAFKGFWHAAIAEIAPDGDEDKLDAEGWWMVKEQVAGDVGVF